MNARSTAIDYIKGLAVISVISAHSNTVFNSTSIFADTCSLILQNVGTFGVICFIVISGMLYRIPEGDKVLFFFRKKLKTIVIPWVISATSVWLYVYLRQPPLTLGSWANFVIGNGSYLYYLTILMTFYVIFSFLPFMRTNAALLLCEAVTAVSCIWCYQIGEMTPYLNPLNWIGFFALGIHLARRKEALVHGKSGMHTLCIVWLSCLAALVVQILRRDGGYYWGGFQAVISWLGAGSLALLGITLSHVKRLPFAGLLRSIGERSLFIYLWHMPVAGITANLLSRGALQYLVLLRPLIVLVIVMTAEQIVQMSLKKMKLIKWGFFIGISG